MCRAQLGVLLTLPSWLSASPTSIPGGNWGRANEILWVDREGAELLRVVVGTTIVGGHRGWRCPT